jgi:hypothetical protein
MEEALGIGKMMDIKSSHVPVGCLKIAGDVVATGWACDRVDCEAYGKWYCPFSW